MVTNWVCSGETNPPYWYYQYISAGTEIPLKDERGNLILLVETNLGTLVSNELVTLEDDLVGEGYKIFRHDVMPSEVTADGWDTNVTNIKALIMSDYNADPGDDWNIFIVGHVPVPYSGLISPGSHVDNLGAHPADWYYADTNESEWTDSTVDNSDADWSDCWNVPGDGKFDQSFLPSVPEFRIGRVDLTNMPAFDQTEAQLTQQYLNRNHQWRHKQFTVRERAVANTNGRPFDSFHLFTSLFGSLTNHELTSWLDVATNTDNSFLIAASSGSGHYTIDHRLGDVTNFAELPLYAVFTSMLGSYYGDWDSAIHSNVVLKAPLSAEGYVLSTFYRDNIISTDVSTMNETIGQELFLTMANPLINAYTRYIQGAQVTAGGTFLVFEQTKNYVSLLGDPTLRRRVVAPPTNIAVVVSGSDNIISWTDAVDSDIQGYHVYRAPAADHNDFTRLTTDPTSSPYTDAGAGATLYTYMVRTVKLEDTVNRSYYNASQGMFVDTEPEQASEITNITVRIYNTGFSGKVTIQ
jgi:hypothetical protein